MSKRKFRMFEIVYYVPYIGDGFCPPYPKNGRVCKVIGIKQESPYSERRKYKLEKHKCPDCTFSASNNWIEPECVFKSREDYLEFIREKAKKFVEDANKNLEAITEELLEIKERR